MKKQAETTQNETPFGEPDHIPHSEMEERFDRQSKENYDRIDKEFMDAMRRRIVEEHDEMGEICWEIQKKGLLGWHNEFPSLCEIPERVFYDKNEAFERFNRLNEVDNLRQLHRHTKRIIAVA